MITFVTVLVVLAAGAARQDHPPACPMHAAHMQGAKTPSQQDAQASHAQMEARGTVAMGFEQSRATHHFTVLATGGVIEITTNAERDEAVRAQIVAHLEDISRRFKAGDFSIPEATHGLMPPGAAEMAGARDRIAYRFEAIPDGGRVLITTSHTDALAAVHRFLRYQIAEHHRGGAPSSRP